VSKNKGKKKVKLEPTKIEANAPVHFRVDTPVKVHRGETRVSATQYHGPNRTIRPRIIRHRRPR